MKDQLLDPDWNAIRERAELFPDEAFEFVRHGLAHTARMLYGDSPAEEADEKNRHVSGRQLCEGLRDLAVCRYGLLARTVLARWGIRRTGDFGVIVYSLIDSGEMRASPDDSLDDFRDVYSFDEAFGKLELAPEAPGLN